MEQPVLKLESILQKEGAALESLRQLFETQGFAFLSFPDDDSNIPASLDRVEQQLLEHEFKYQSYVPSFGTLGLQDAPYKTSFTCLSGKEAEAFMGKHLNAAKNAGLKQALLPLVSQLDECLKSLAEATCEPLFGKTSQQLGRELDIPFLDQRNSDDASFALFDAALYKNRNEDTTDRPAEGGNCVEHYDPGLYSLWLGETQPGLKLRDAQGNWVPPAPGSCVLWLGQAACVGNPKFVPALHRVDLPVVKDEKGGLDNQNKGLAPPRLSVWTELCTREQVLSLSYGKDNAKFASAKVIEVENAFGGTGEPYRIRVENGNVEQALLTTQEVLRMPYSKSIRSPVYDEEKFVIGTKHGWGQY